MFIADKRIVHTVSAPALTVVNNRKLFFGQHAAVTNQERLLFKKYFLTALHICYLTKNERPRQKQASFD